MFSIYWSCMNWKTSRQAVCIATSTIKKIKEMSENQML